ncbi:MAG: DNA mismatch repair endonuclease MutL [Patescibacteria group bacterium]
MGNIRILPKKVASKIAAGEVIQRPADVVKELIENSLDAEASNIHLKISGAGLDIIQVRDNGVGMSVDDLEKCFLPHATSKIFHEDDIYSISSMGFRGEALSSIAAISRTTIQSKPNSSTEGNLLELTGGMLEGISPCGMPNGTIVTVENLFFNVPVRKKFLKSTQVEFAEILSVVTSLALSFPEVGFTIEKDEKVVLSLLKNSALDDRIRDIYGEDLFAQLLPVTYEGSHVTLHGYISRPQVTTTSSSKQSLIINNRVVSEKVLLSAIRNAYGTLLQPRVYPAFLLHLKFPPELVDVNVHPRKQEVKFINPKLVTESVSSAINKALQVNDLTYIKSGFSFTNEFLLKDADYVANLRKHSSSIVLEEIIQVHNQYLISESARGIYLIDQHAAHERIIFEQLFEKFKTTNKSEAIKLDSPHIFNLSNVEALLLKEHLYVFESIGFRIQEFGSNAFRVTQVPVFYQDRNITSILSEMLDDLVNEGFVSDIDIKSERALSYLACRSAIKTGEVLNLETRKTLLEQLAETKTKYTCPHGRPVKIEISLKDLDKLFKRT